MKDPPKKENRDPFRQGEDPWEEEEEEEEEGYLDRPRVHLEPSEEEVQK